ncbi:hypothetical protein JCGZ_08635 [Jatropha curcas]|uniref:F-box domain-containing protein n=2 Tax=Jatropha curcas TaxID=180498 RepID=A0A067J916_JATCU|nr:hypothetical protein JCGZ_08635 [Jatropha curcas]
MDIVSSIVDHDMISNIPQNVTENILARLPLQEAVRTSLLSKNWRHKWKTVPLVFDNTFENHFKAQPPAKNELLLIIFQVLLLCRCPVIKFTLSISGMESCPEIDHMLDFLTRNGIQELTLCIKKGKPHTIPQCIFSCKTLRHMHLSSCSFKLPVAFDGLNELISASFNDVCFNTNAAVENLLLKCPLLERLELTNCQNVDHLDISAPNLKFLSISLLFKSICFKDTPLLTKAVIRGWKGIYPEVKEASGIDMVEVFSCLPSIEHLQISFYFLMILAARNLPERLPAPLNSLKTLEIVSLCFGELKEVSCTLCLIRSSPFLQKLKIYVFNEQNEDSMDVVELLEVQKHSNILQHQLQEVEMKAFVGTKPQMEFVKFLLSKSPLLQRMHIHPCNTMNIAEEVRILKEITRYRRASTEAEIIFSNQNQKNA